MNLFAALDVMTGMVNPKTTKTKKRVDTIISSMPFSSITLRRSIIAPEAEGIPDMVSSKIHAWFHFSLEMALAIWITSHSPCCLKRAIQSKGLTSLAVQKLQVC